MAKMPSSNTVEKSQSAQDTAPEGETGSPIPDSKSPAPAKTRAAAKPKAAATPARTKKAATSKAVADKKAGDLAEKPVKPAKPRTRAAAAKPKQTATHPSLSATKSSSRDQVSEQVPASTGAAKDQPVKKAAKSAPAKQATAPAAPTAKKPAAKPAAKAPAEQKPVKPVDKEKDVAVASPEMPSPMTSPEPSAASAPMVPEGKDAPQINRRWLASYPPNVPHEIGELPAQSLGKLMDEACKRYEHRTAFSCMGTDLTYGEMADHASRFGAYLQGQGLAPGTRIAIMMPNILQYPVALMGILQAGYVVVNVNPLYTSHELAHQIKDSGAEAIIILENFAATLDPILKETSLRHIIVASMGDLMGVKGMMVNLVVRHVKKMVPSWSLPGHISFNAALKAGAKRRLKPAHIGPEDLAFLQYTGGTTGISKGAMLTHRNILANIAMNLAWLESAYRKKTRPRNPTFICALPLYHIYALTVNLLMGMELGAQNVLIPNPRDIPAFVKELAKYKMNILPGLNTLFNALLNNEQFRKLDFSGLVLTFGGGMAVQQVVADRWKELTGCIISEGYGLSETSPVACANRFDAEEFSGTIGLPLPSTDISLRDEADHEVALGEPGEICIRGPQVMKGYWKRPEETVNAMTPDGFFRSGDIGVMDEGGYIKIVDRKKDMILVSGFNVYPTEIEEVLASHPGVLEVAVIGVKDEKSGEVPKAFIVRKDPALTEKDLKDFCHENLTGYKRPRHFEFRDELPKSNVGKILRRELRDKPKA